MRKSAYDDPDLWFSLNYRCRYIPNIKKVAEVKKISPTQSIWTLYYTFPPPVSPRVFTVLQVTDLDESTPKTGHVSLDSIWLSKVINSVFIES